MTGEDCSPLAWELARVAGMHGSGDRDLPCSVSVSLSDRSVIKAMGRTTTDAMRKVAHKLDRWNEVAAPHQETGEQSTALGKTRSELLRDIIYHAGELVRRVEGYVKLEDAVGFRQALIVVKRLRAMARFELDQARSREKALTQ